MAGSTWTWIGGAINVDSPRDWVLTSGPGDSADIPETGDTAVNNGTLVGDGVIAASVVNNGTIDVSNNSVPGSSTGGDLEIEGALTGSGSVTIEPGATSRIDGALGSGQAIAFAPGTPETLILGSPTGTISNPITGYDDGDKIEFSNGITLDSVALSNSNTLVIDYHNVFGTVGTYDLTDITFAANAPSLILLRADPATGGQFVVPTRLFTWVGGSSTNFGSATNWNFRTLVPGEGDIAEFQNGVGGTISGSGTVGVLNFFNGGTWSLASGTDLSFDSELIIDAGFDQASTGNLIIGAGGTITGGGFSYVGEDAGNVDTLTITGGGVFHETGTVDPAVYAMYVGFYPSSGTLAASSGSVVVTGQGSLLDLGSSGMVLGDDGGNGSMTVSQGGSVHAATVNSNVNGALAIGRLSDGTLTVTDPGSQFTATGQVYVSHTQTGSLLVEDSGTFLAAPDAMGIAGLLLGDGTALGVGGTGVATVTTDGLLDSQGFVIVGLDGTSGQLAVLNGGTVLVGTTLTVGEGGTISNGTTETGSGTLTIGAGSTVALTGTAQTASYGVFLGQSNIGTAASENAVATVSGAGALLDSHGNGIEVGQYGTATLTVSQGGSVVSSSPNSNLLGALAIGQEGSGTVTVTGTGSRLTADGNTYIGRAGTGGLDVESGGGVTIGLDPLGNGALDVGGGGVNSTGTAWVGGTGAVVVGSGGNLLSKGDIVVGEGGATGTLSVANGAIAAGGRLQIGVSVSLTPGATLISPTGTVTVTSTTVETGAGSVTVGANGVLTIDQSGSSGTGIVLGDAAGSTGSLNVAGGGTVIAGGGLTLFQNSTVSIASGGSVTVGGSGTINAWATLTNDGILTLSNGTLTGSGSVINNGSIIVDPSTLTLAALTGTGEVVVGNDSTVTTLGTVAAGETIVFAGGNGDLSLAFTTFSGTVEGFDATDTIDLPGVTDATSAGIVNGNTLQIQRSGNPAISLALDPDQNYTGALFAVDFNGALTSDLDRTLSWTGGGGSPAFATAANWDDITDSLNAAQTAPGVTDTAEFLTGGGSIGGAGTVAALAFGGPSQWLLGASSTLTAAGVAGVTVGAGLLSLTTGANIISLGSTDILSGSSSQSASVTVNGTGSAWNSRGELLIGGTGLGGLAIQAGGTVAAGAGLVIANTAPASGSAVNIVGAGSSLQVTGSLIVGGAGFGALSVSQGATVSAGSLDEAAADGGDGGITVDGSGSALNITGALSVGDQSSGSLNIINGATASVGSLIIGNGIAGSGDVVIGPGSKLILATTTINVGVAGSGVLDIQGGTLSLVNGTSLSPGSFGRIVQVGGLIDPAAVLDATGGSFGGGGTAEASGTITNSGVAAITGGSETFLAPVVTAIDPSVDTGTWRITSGGTLVLDVNSVDNTQVIQFGDATGVLEIGQQVSLDVTQTPQPTGVSALDGFQAPIIGYRAGDKITFADLPFASDTVNGNVVTLWSGAAGTGTDLGSLTFQTTKFGNDNAGAALAATQIATLQCFVAGTLIETVDGPRAVETLAVGDEVRTLLGGPGRIVWVGSRAVDCARHPWPETVWPVRVRVGAFGVGMPARDLYLSPDHAVFVDGVLVPVKLLVNGTTVRQVKRRRVVYHHIELDQHDVTLAEGLAVETYLDTGDQGNFDGGTVVALHPNFSARTWEMRGCAELVTTGVKLHQVRTGIAKQTRPAALSIAG
jgi:T5SS/PEP-CTERM-associated repeat protein